MAGEFKSTAETRLAEVKDEIAHVKDDVAGIQATLDQAQARLASLRSERDEINAYLAANP